MPQLSIGIQLTSLGLPFQRGLQEAARIGVSAVEIDARVHVKPRECTATALRQLRKLLDDLNLKVCAVRFRTRSGYNVTDRLQERVEATKAAMNLAYKLGAKVVVNQIGRVPEETQRGRLGPAGRRPQRAWKACTTMWCVSGS